MMGIRPGAPGMGRGWTVSGAERQRAYRERHPEYVAVDNYRRRASRRPYSTGGARNPDRLMANEKKSLRAMGFPGSEQTGLNWIYPRGYAASTSCRPETGRPYFLYGGSDGTEAYCADGYLQGEPCPWGCWGITDG